MPRLVDTWRVGKQRHGDGAGFGAEKRWILALPQNLETLIELALQTIECLRVGAVRGAGVEYLVQTVLALDEEVQAPLAEIDVEGEQEPDPGG